MFRDPLLMLSQKCKYQWIYNLINHWLVVAHDKEQLKEYIGKRKSENFNVVLHGKCSIAHWM